jgi:D-3-phosphoglycerate dehydrogenase
MIKILANDGIEESAKEFLESKGFLISTEKVAQENLIDEINKVGYSAILVRSATQVRQNLIDACPNLKLIGRGGVGMDNIDVKYAESKGLQVINTPAASSQSVAELVFAHLFSLARFLHLSNREMPQNGLSDFAKLKKAYSKGFELSGKTIGIIGFGRIGQSVAKAAIGLGMNVLPHDPWVKNASIDIDLLHNGEAISIEFDTVDLDTVLSQSDVITLHIPKTSDGKPYIKTDDFAKLKKGVILINTSRGGLIDEDALLENLNNGKVGAAGLDVFVGEPTPKAELLNHPLISVSPHIGGSTSEAQERVGMELADKIVAFFL